MDEATKLVEKLTTDCHIIDAAAAAPPSFPPVKLVSLRTKTPPETTFAVSAIDQPASISRRGNIAEKGRVVHSERSLPPTHKVYLTVCCRKFDSSSYASWRLLFSVARIDRSINKDHGWVSGSRLVNLSATLSSPQVLFLPTSARKID